MASSPIIYPRGTTDKRRTTTTNSSSSHHHDSAPSRPHSLICTGAEPIHPVHCPRKLPAWPWSPETRSFFCHFGGFFFDIVYVSDMVRKKSKRFDVVPRTRTCMDSSYIDSQFKGTKLMMMITFITVNSSLPPPHNQSYSETETFFVC